MAKVLNDSFGVTQGMFTTVHAYTNDQACSIAAQGPAPGARRRSQHHPDLDRRRAGRRQGAAGTRRQA